MKKSMKNTLISPPIHVHVSDTTPVHVHVRKQRPSTPTTPQALRPTAKDKTCLPWTPRGKTTLVNGSYMWEGPKHQLEIVPPLPTPNSQHSQGALQLADLTQQGEGLHSRITDYEKKIDNLMTGVSSLKNEVEMRKKVTFLEHQSEQLDVSQRVIIEQEEELSEVTKELKETERENARLRQAVEKMLQESDYRAEGDARPKADALLRKLIEAEEHGIAAVNEVKALRESISKRPGSFGSLKRPSGSESLRLDHHHDLFLQKLETFEATNKSLRNLLREHEGSQMELTRLSEQKDSLLKRLAETEAENGHLVVNLQEKENEMSHLSKRLEAEKEHAKSTTHMSKSLEQTRAHLQRQLRNKEAENNRLTVQIKNLERAAGRQKAEMDHLQQQQTRLKQKVSADKNALKQATRLQKQRAELIEDTSGQLSVQLLELEKQVEEALCAAEMWQGRHAEEIKEKNKLEMELSVLNRRVKELNEQLLSSGDGGRENRDLIGQLQELTSQSATAKLENQSLKATASAVEKKLGLSQSELQQVRASIKQYESLVDSYKIQVESTRAEADEYRAKLAQAEIDAQAVRREVEQEVEQVRRELLTRVTELESLPDTLRYSEQRLQEARDKMHTQERRSMELSSTLTELRLKVESQGSQMELVKQKNKVLMTENKELQQKAESLERKLDEVVTQNSDLLSVISKRDEIIQNNQSRLQDKTRECSLLSKKLDEALDDAHQQMSQTRERAALKEHSTQAKILDLETQLSRTTSEINQMQRCKDEVERRYKSRLLDLKDRLQQSDRTNKSLQNYVQFLKSSYAVIGDSPHNSNWRSPSPI